MQRLAGLFAVVPASGLLSISFFVLFAIRRTDSRPLKAFGYVVCTFLWIAASLVLGSGAYHIAKGTPMMCSMMKKMKMEQKMHGPVEEKGPVKKDYGMKHGARQ